MGTSFGAWCLGTANHGVSRSLGVSIQITQPHNTDADLQPFVGTWQARFKGKVFQTIKLEKKQDKLTGTVNFHANINVDPKSGELTDVEILDGSDDAIVEAILTNGILRITEADVQFDMKVTGADQAQLQIVVPPDVAGDVPTPKPWKLKRAKSGQ